jgi:hypothetical protein
MTRRHSLASLALLLAGAGCARAPLLLPLSEACDCRTTLDDLRPHANCLSPADHGAYQVRPELLRALRVEAADAPFAAYSRCGMFWVRPDGRARTTQLYDNGADYFSQGLTRYLSHGKYGYMNANLDVVVEPSYDFAYPFEAGKGIVCQGCRFHTDGEHGSVSCTRCGAVNTAGQLVEALGSRDAR